MGEGMVFWLEENVEGMVDWELMDDVVNMKGE